MLPITEHPSSSCWLRICREHGGIVPANFGGDKRTKGLAENVKRLYDAMATAEERATLVNKASDSGECLQVATKVGGLMNNFLLQEFGAAGLNVPAALQAGKPPITPGPLAKRISDLKNANRDHSGVVGHKLPTARKLQEWRRQQPDQDVQK
jgi:hypothetical protein